VKTLEAPFQLCHRASNLILPVTTGENMWEVFPTTKDHPWPSVQFLIRNLSHRPADDSIIDISNSNFSTHNTPQICPPYPLPSQFSTLFHLLGKTDVHHKSSI
jgi:hypothetical protein